MYKGRTSQETTEGECVCTNRGIVMNNSIFKMKYDHSLESFEDLSEFEKLLMNALIS